MDTSKAEDNIFKKEQFITIIWWNLRKTGTQMAKVAKDGPMVDQGPIALIASHWIHLGEAVLL